jgi:hypothetical protein
MSKLTRSKQEKIELVIEAFVNQHSECKPWTQDSTGVMAAPNYCGGPCPPERVQSNRARPLRLFVSERAKGNPNLSFSFSRFCFRISNDGRKTNAAGTSASPPYEGGLAAEWMAAKRASARAA